MNHKKITTSVNIKAMKKEYQSRSKEYYEKEAKKYSKERKRALQRISPHESKVSFNKPNRTLCGKRSYVVCVGKKYPELITIDSPPNTDTSDEELERMLLESQRLIERCKKYRERFYKNEPGLE